MRALAAKGTGNTDIEHKRAEATQDKGSRFRVQGLGIRPEKGTGDTHMENTRAEATQGKGL
jgi:hypothetical protein